MEPTLSLVIGKIEREDCPGLVAYIERAPRSQGPVHQWDVAVHANPNVVDGGSQPRRVTQFEAQGSEEDAIRAASEALVAVSRYIPLAQAAVVALLGVTSHKAVVEGTVRLPDLHIPSY